MKEFIAQASTDDPKNGFRLTNEEIVRCKDCRWNDGTAYCEMHFRDVSGGDFCSWAERRNDE